MKRLLLCGFLVLGILAFNGCARVGANFDEAKLDKVVNGVTTKAEVEALFGQPFKTGLQNGFPVWVYEYNYYHALGRDTSKDIFFVFEKDGNIVRSHQVMSSEPTP